MNPALFDIDVVVETACASELVTLLRETIRHILIQEKVLPPASLTLLLADDDQLRQLNLQFLGEDKPTDVLSFPAGEPLPGMEPKDGSGYLGDVAISVPYAQRQADQAGHQCHHECQLLAVHGVLHLLAYDHTTDEAKSLMWQAQTTALQALNVPLLMD